MSVEEFISLRLKLGLTQTLLAGYLGMSLRALQDIENGRAALRPVHILAFERIALMLAAKRGDPLVAPEAVIADARAVAAHF